MPKQLPVIESTPTASACCAPLTQAPLTLEEAEDLAVRLKAIADPTRLRLLSLMLASPDREACTCDLTEPLGLTQPTVTHHLRTLAKAGIVVPHRRVGNFTYYQVVSGALRDVLDLLRGRAAGTHDHGLALHPAPRVRRSARVTERRLNGTATGAPPQDRAGCALNF